MELSFRKQIEVDTFRRFLPNAENFFRIKFSAESFTIDVSLDENAAYELDKKHMPRKEYLEHIQKENAALSGLFKHFKVRLH